MNEYLDDVLIALQGVDERYFSWIDEVSTKNPDEETMIERVFCYEFYHQFRKIMERKGKYGNLIFNGEIRKDGINFLDTTFPDFVLHAGQNNFNNQECIIEVKTKKNITNKDFIKDIFKLAGLIVERDFESGIFICTNVDNIDLLRIVLDESKYIKENIKILSKNKDYDVLDKIYLFATNSARNGICGLKYCCLNDLIKKNQFYNQSI